TDGASVPVGGETCAVNPPRSGCASALAELERHHWSFLNRDYHPDVLAAWRTAGCWDTIACRLGYRLRLARHAHPRETPVGRAFPLWLRLGNDGYARPINPRPVHVALEPTSLPTTTNAPSSLPVLLATAFDAQALGPGHDRDVCLAVDLPSELSPGTYRVGLALPDPAPSLRADPRYAVQLAAGASWDAARGINWLDAAITFTR
ncbi:MAG TPA: DUF4832 domain-containing protein, partial [Polyangia bacterium]